MYAHKCLNCGKNTDNPALGCKNGCRSGFRLSEVSERKQQKTMFAGMDCEPGQMDLFETDGGAYE